MEGTNVFLILFFQAEDGIRDADVTGVQTCALPILSTDTNGVLKNPLSFFLSNSNLINMVVSGSGSSPTSGITTFNGKGTNTLITNGTFYGSFTGNAAGATNIPITSITGITTNNFVNTNEPR